MSYKRRECLQQLKLPQTVTVVQIHSSRAHACKHMCVCTLDIFTTITSCPILLILRILNSLLKGNERQANFKFPVLGGLGGSTNLHTLIITQVQEPVRLVQFWPDHFFGDKFITDICACAITDAVPYAAPITAGSLQKSFLRPCITSWFTSYTFQWLVYFAKQCRHHKYMIRKLKLYNIGCAPAQCTSVT